MSRYIWVFSLGLSPMFELCALHHCLDSMPSVVWAMCPPLLAGLNALCWLGSMRLTPAWAVCHPPVYIYHYALHRCLGSVPSNTVWAVCPPPLSGLYSVHCCLDSMPSTPVWALCPPPLSGLYALHPCLGSMHSTPVWALGPPLLSGLYGLCATSYTPVLWALGPPLCCRLLYGLCATSYRPVLCGSLWLSSIDWSSLCFWYVLYSAVVFGVDKYSTGISYTR